MPTKTYYPLTTPQQNIWNLQKYYDNTAIGNLCGAIFYQEQRNDKWLAQAVNHLIRRQTGLRLRFTEESGQPQQFVQEYSLVEIPVHRFENHEDFERYVSLIASESLGLTDHEMYRFEITHIGNCTGVLAVLSHLIGDAWSFRLIAEHIDRVYGYLKEGGDREKTEEEYDYTAFIRSEQEYLQSDKYKKDEMFWLEKYVSEPAVTPVKTVLTPVASIAAQRYRRKLSPVFSRAIREFCRDFSVTQAVLFETALSVYLSRIHSEYSSVSFGIPVLNRSGIREKNTVGMFISTMPLSVEISPEEQAEQLAKRITAAHFAVFRHQKYPYADILENVRSRQNFSGQLYDVMVSFQNAQIDGKGFSTEWFSNGYSEVPFALHIDDRDQTDAYTVTIDYQTEVFRQTEEISLIMDRLEFIIAQIMADSKIPVKNIDIIPKRERQRMLLEFNDTAMNYPKEKCVHELFAEQVKKMPEKPALVFEEKEFTYRQLEEMSNSLAYFLREEGVRPNDVVPIIARRSWHIIVAMLGVLKAGGAYMPVDPDYPEDRIRNMIEIAHAVCALRYDCDKRLPVKTYDLKTIDYTCHMSAVQNVNRPEDLCYVIFTSGSTGEPKGISLCHKSVINYACESGDNIACHELVKSKFRRMVSVTNIIFDIFVTESLMPLLNGMTVYFANDREVMRQNRLNRLICENQIEVMQTTPTKMRGYLDESQDLEYLQSLKCMIFGGEALSYDLVRKIRNYTSAKIFNIYGPAETTVWSTNKEVTSTNDITIGKPIANTQIYILGQDHALLPVGVAGELCIAGAGVGRGYLNRPELTAERFIKNPFATEKNGHGKMMYRTGDLARWRADGEIEYLGRIDTQVKIRGLRIELGEIEHVMNGFPGIRTAAVAEKRDANNRQYLAGYYTAEQEVDVRELRRHLASKLPGYMVPNYFVALDAMPMTPSGKIDRKNLPLPDFTIQGLEYVAPETETEKRLAEIWQEELPIERAGKNDNFLESGGDSLLAITMLNQVEIQFQVTMSVRDIMESPSLEQLARLIDEAEPKTEGIAAHNRKRYRLLPQQKAIYVNYRKNPNALTYNIPAVVKIPENIDREKLKRCILETVNRHQALKTRIAAEGEEIYGVLDETAEIQVEEYDETNGIDFVKPFCLDRAPLVRIGFTKDTLLFDIHHIIADGRSLDIILRDIAVAYQNIGTTESAYQYSDYAEYFWQKDFTEHKSYFREMLKCDFAPVVLPERVKMSNAEKTMGQTGQSVIYDLPESEGKQAKYFARKNGLTDTMVFLGAYGILLAKYTGQEDIFSSVVFSNRIHQEMQNVVGMFVNTLPVAFSAKGSTAAYFGQIKQMVLCLHQYQELPFTEIAEAVGMQDKSALNTAFIYQGDGEKQLLLNGQILTTEFVDTNTAKFDFCMEVTPSDSGYKIRMEYNKMKYDDVLMSRLYKAYVQILSQLDKEQLVDISVLSGEERYKLLTEFNDTAVAYPKDKCVHELFTEQAKKTPEKLALVFEDKRFTYKQLDEMSNSLAHLLREKGVGPNDVVPIIARRSWHVIVAMFGVLKAGGAYMLIDSDYPVDRIAYMLSETCAKYMMVYKCNVKIENVYIIELDIINWKRNIKDIENHNFNDDICYVLFTSGTTGRPKAVSISHLSLCNFINRNSKNEYQNNLLSKCQCVLSITTLMFDIFIFETQLPLLNGLTVVLSKNISDALEMSKLVIENDVDALHVTPTKLLMLLQTEEFQKTLKKIKVLMSGAEAFTQEFYEELLKYTNAHIYNGYGPTETTIGCCFKNITDISDITIGKPIANTQIYILDHSQSLLPIGVPGELCIAGDGVGKGYLNRPELTAERFVKNPFATEENGHGKMMYRTGDLARWRADGEIEYLGRIDTQVKIRGLRIELGEIEHVMNGFPGIRMAVVAEKRDENNRQYLAGYYTAEQDVCVRELRRHLASKLPRYMVPNYFVELDGIPMTPSGKIDRKNLPLPDFTIQGLEYVAAETATEKRLAEIWQKELPIERAGKNDNFLESGGDSLLAIMILNQVETQFQVTMSVRDIMESPSLEHLARLIDEAEPKTEGIAAHNRKRYRLLPQQKAIYVNYRKTPNALTYNIPAMVKIPENIDREKLKRCILETVNRYQALKTRIVAEGEEIYGVLDETAEIQVEEYEEINENDFVKPFCLDRAPLVRIGLTADTLLFDIHHIIADGMSLNIILRDIAVACQGDETVESVYQYSDYAEYFWQKDFTEHKSYFREMLKCDFAPVVLPERVKMSNAEKTMEQTGQSVIYDLPESEGKQAKYFAWKNGLTDTMVFLGAYGILLAKYTGQEDIFSSVVFSNRIHQEMQDVVGMFVNTLPVAFSAKGSTAAYFGQIKQMVLCLHQYQELPLTEIAEAVGMRDKSVLNTAFIYQGDGEKQLLLNGQILPAEFVDTHTAKFDFCMEVTPSGNGYKIRMEYNRMKYDDVLMSRLYKAYVQILTQLDKERIADISVLLEEERYKLLTEFNDTAVVYPKDKCVHELFTEQAKKTPEKLALVFEDKRFTYRQLDEMSNSLAHLLREKGVGPNDVVPIIARRSWHVIVAMFGVLKAGGAYMLVDPSYPIDRIQNMIEMTNAVYVLQYGYNRKLSVKTFSLEEINYNEYVSAILNKNKPEDSCYVIFTSGSTGVPKCVTICHRNVINYAHVNAYNITCNKLIKGKIQKIVSVTNIIFDIFITESIFPLLNGMTVYFANDQEVFQQTKLNQLICKNQIEVIQTTPTRMNSYLNVNGDMKYLYLLKCIVLGGEALSFDLTEKIKYYTNAKIFNIYGPAETTVWSTNKEVKDVFDITIGKPIANTQIYILDHSQSLLPIGVPGELCIAGDGVGKGYLNRPELTAERFVKNPFATEENGHGKMMYRTGDLARWREDGEIEYLGRIDTQVKIRGLRIELGEIEHVMNGFPGIRTAVVAEKRDENNRQYLAGYYTAEQEVDVREMRRHLASKLPRYMVPNYFVALDVMPMTPSGKTDRKNLPLPDFTVQRLEYVAPETEKEKILCGIMADILHLETVGAEDDFFELGGDSLKAIELIAKAQDAGIDIALQNVFDYPTVRQLGEFLENGTDIRILYEMEDFVKYQPLLERNVIDETFVPHRQELGNILLTGATGFLGAHILDVLMRETTGTVYCLVRENGEEDSRQRLEKILRYYFDGAYIAELGKRIVAVSGDIEQEGLSPELPGNIRTIIHGAASVKHYGSYAYFDRINVQGTRHVVDCAKSIGAKLIHISTLSVSGNSMAEEFNGYRSEEEKQFYETSFYIGQPLDNVYIHSKFEAEKAVYDAMLEGLEAKVIRVGNLTNRVSDYKFQPNYQQNAFLTRVKATLEFGLFPDYLMSLYSEFSPVDLTAEGIVKIARYAGGQCVFHLNSNRPLYFKRMMEILEKLHISMKVVPGDIFYEELRRTLKRTGTEYIYEAFQNDMDGQGRLVYDSNIRIRNEFTVWFMERVGFYWNETDETYLRGYIEYFCRLGYLEV